MLTIISIIHKQLQDIEKTCGSVDIQGSSIFEHIIVASGFSAENKKILMKNWNSDNRKFIFDQDSSLYNAMNIGLNVAQGDWILFLNGGDVLFDASAIEMVIEKQKTSCLAFSTAQRFEQDLYIRPPCKIKRELISGCGHQGFVAPLDPDKSRRIYYNEANYISGDQEWIRLNIKRYGVDLHNEVLSEFHLGGISNRPSIRALTFQLKARNFRSVVKLLLKMVLYFLLHPRRYYKFMARFNRYKIIE